MNPTCLLVLALFFVATFAQNDIKCSTCEFLTGYIIDNLPEEATRDQIVAFLQKGCDIMPPSLKPRCLEFIQKYTTVLIEEILARYTPTEICVHLKLCSLDLSLPEPANDLPDVCPICERVIAYAEEHITSESSQQAVMEFLSTVCLFVGPTYKAQCEAMITMYYPELLELLVSKFPPKYVCELLKICPQQSNSNDLVCPMCQWVIGTIESKISEETTRQEIIGFVEQVCNFVPASLNPTCKLLVEQYGNLIIDLMVERYSANVVCQMIGLCEVPQLPDNSVRCDLCVDLMNELVNYINNERTQEKVIEALEKVCFRVPATLQPACHSIVTNYADFVFQFLMHAVHPHQICEFIKLCPVEAFVIHSLDFDDYQDIEQVSPETEAPVLIPSPVLDFTCDACKTAVAAGFKYLDNVDPKAVSKYCEMVEDKFQQILCKGFVEGYLPIIIKNFEEAYAPEKTCALIKLCPAA
ncbi:hypothetical protein RCL1_002871 [Eukaryota sp. TZLM3-RCL]